MKRGMTFEYLMCRADLNFEVVRTFLMRDVLLEPRHYVFSPYKQNYYIHKYEFVNFEIMIE